MCICMHIFICIGLACITARNAAPSIYFSRACKCDTGMGWLWLVGSIRVHVSFAKEPYKRDDILQKRPIILRSLLIVATP